MSLHDVQYLNRYVESAAHSAEQAAEVIAVVLPDGTPEQPDAITDFVATGTMLLVRHADGRMALEPVRRDQSVSRSAASPSGHGMKSRSRPILDPVSREVMGYEMELGPNPSF